MKENKLFGWYCSDGEHRGFLALYEYEIYGWKKVIPLYKLKKPCYKHEYNKQE